MTLHWQRNLDDHSITRFDAAGIQIQDTYYNHSLLLSADTLIKDWSVTSIADLTLDALQPILQKQPEVLLLGTGQRQVFPEMSLFQTIITKGIGLEVMTTEAACRTFNVLLSENRKVAAALILEN